MLAWMLLCTLISVNMGSLFQIQVREKKSNANAAVGEIADFIRENFDSKESGIVYCFSRKECEQVANIYIWWSLHSSFIAYC